MACAREVELADEVCHDGGGGNKPEGELRARQVGDKVPVLDGLGGFGVQGREVR